MVNSVHIEDTDSCVIVTADIKKGEKVTFSCFGKIKSVIAKSDVPAYHKVAVVKVKAGDFVYKYGEKIGRAETDIEPGDYVHTHNLKPVGFIEGE
ncbi:MAG: UxaA family hydrolase [Oscillospiraceae bacterium]